MRFDAIVHAPCLRHGARLNIAKADQAADAAPARLSVGSEVRLRFGVCCSDHARGTIVGSAAQPERVVLEVGSDSWTLLKGSDDAITVPGLISESWYVAEPGGAEI